MRKTFGWMAGAFMSILLVSISISLLLGFGGEGFEAGVYTNAEYHPYLIGNVSIYLRNGWWTRHIDVKEISISIDGIQNYEWKIENDVSSLDPGEKSTILATLKTLEHKYGVFEYTVLVEFTQSLMFTFGSEELRYAVSGNITISP